MMHKNGLVVGLAVGLCIDSIKHLDTPQNLSKMLACDCDCPHQIWDVDFVKSSLLSFSNLCSRDTSLPTSTPVILSPQEVSSTSHLPQNSTLHKQISNLYFSSSNHHRSPRGFHMANGFSSIPSLSNRLRSPRTPA